MENDCVEDFCYVDQDTCVDLHTRETSQNPWFSWGGENAWIIEEKLDAFFSGDLARIFLSSSDLWLERCYDVCSDDAPEEEIVNEETDYGAFATGNAFAERFPAYESFLLARRSYSWIC